MKNLGKSILCGIVAMFATTIMATAPSSATQFTPKLMNYQGYLANPSTGNPYADGIYRLECRLYRVATGGTAIWGGRYSVYVKNGYFNIMLGDSAGENLGYTYSNTDLWRAIWSDTAVSSADQRNNLWLGVTPLENASGATISSPTEIKPRQQLLTAPYAFRAQSAEYANESYNNFTVNGTLTVTGSLSLPSSYTLGGITSSSSSLKLSGTGYSSSNPILYGYGSTMYLYPYNDLKIAPYAGNIEITVPSGKSLNVKNNSFSVSNASTSMYSSGNTSISAGGALSMSATGGNATISASGASTVSSTGIATFRSTGSYAQLAANEGNVYVSPATNKILYCQGTQNWRSSATGYYRQPFIIKNVSVTISSGKQYGSYTFTDNEYRYVIGGYTLFSFYSDPGGVKECRVTKSSSSNQWTVNIITDQANGSASGGTVYKVTLLGVLTECVNDQR